MRIELLRTSLKGFAVGTGIIFGLGMTPVPPGWNLGRVTNALVPSSAAQLAKLSASIEKMGSPLKNWGLFNKQGPSHIHAPEAWTLTDGKRGVIVAVIDTGIDPVHNALMMNLWRNPNSAPGKPEWGWNFITDTPNPTDEHGHGTHVSGIIGALSDPERGISGVAHQVSIMPVKYYSERNSGEANLRNTVRAIHYAIDHGAKIINYSGGGPEFSEDEYLAIKRAEARGILFVAAAGNEGANIDLSEHYYYPSAYRLSNIISVAATDIHNELLPTSNWGKTRVDLTAPGESIFSTLPGNRTGMMSGTSRSSTAVPPASCPAGCATGSR
ncbi:MAG: S8 family peptidase, partial [Bdellovibrionota bacterium]